MWKLAPRPPRIRGWVLFAIVVVIGVYAYSRVDDLDADAVRSKFDAFGRSSILNPATLPSAEFHCDDRSQCTQMHSCAEAKYFMTYCPNTNLDGNANGVPCEEKLCR